MSNEIIICFLLLSTTYNTLASKLTTHVNVHDEETLTLLLKKSLFFFIIMIRRRRGILCITEYSIFFSFFAVYFCVDQLFTAKHNMV